jgi:hypothetical protein
MLKCTEKLMHMYQTNLGVSPMKDAVTLPGIVLRHLFNAEMEWPFSLVKAEDRDLHKMFRDNMRGGLSMVQCRYHESYLTYLRGDQRFPCRAIEGYDQNALYLCALSRTMPSDYYVRWRVDPDSGDDHLHRKTSMPGAIEWLRWLRYSQECSARPGEKCKIRDSSNGPEIRLGKLFRPVDGVCQQCKTVYEFHGCHAHWHDDEAERAACPTQQKHDREVKPNLSCGRPIDEEVKARAEKKADLEAAGYTVVEQPSCRWYARTKLARAKKFDPELGDFLRAHDLPYSYRRKVRTVNVRISDVL